LHPLRLLIAIDWLFEGAKNFLHWCAVRPAIGSCVKADANDDMLTPPGYASKQRLVEHMLQGASATAAARQMGISVVTAMAWAAQSGIRVRPRAKVLIPSVRTTMINDLRHGADKRDVAAQNGVSTETVTRLLSTEVGLRAAWQSVRIERARERARDDWLRLLTAHRAQGVAHIRSMQPAVYAWLYRNDRAWLADNAPHETHIEDVPRTTSVRWDERDRALSAAVLQVALELMKANGTRRLRLWHLYQALPELKAKLSALDRLPLTTRAIAEVLRRRPGPGVETCSRSEA
jgi:hypothetical protein